VEDSYPSALRSPVARAWLGSWHCADVSFVSRADGEPVCDFIVPSTSRAGGVDTVARE
jgi:hypothetical protein